MKDKPQVKVMNHNSEERIIQKTFFLLDSGFNA